MLDPAMIEALSHALKPMPAIVQPAAEFGESVDRFKERTLKQIADAEAGFSKWRAEGETVRDALSDRLRAAQSTEGMSANAMRDYLDRVIAKIDALNAANAAEFDRMAASFKRQIKHAGAFGKSTKAVIGEIADGCMSLMERELDERGDFALFLRAWRAKFDPEAQDGPVFETPSDLERYIRSVLAA